MRILLPGLDKLDHRKHIAFLTSVVKAQYGREVSAEDEYVARVRDVAVRHLAPIAPVHGAGQPTLVKALGDHGLLQDVIDGTATQLCLLRETLGDGQHGGRDRARPAGARAARRSCCTATLRRSSAGCPGVGAGDVVAGFALSEADAGSDAAGPCPAGGTGR
jgi:alkylation response protein AidB-like acyl-CoA dehydrogenase